LCPHCEATNTNDSAPKGVLKVVYNFKQIASKYAGKELFNELKNNRFLDLLPVSNVDSLPFLKIGETPVYDVSRLLGKNLHQLFIKDDSQNPTYSFKDRASAVVSAFAKEHGIVTIAAASTGNAGSSIAGICASQQQKAIVFVPGDAPLAKLTQIAMYGAKLIPVKGTYDDAFDLSIKASKAFGWYNRNTAYNPLTIEGKKTVAFEIYDQFKGQLPDYIFVPVGDGVIISGVYKGFEDLLNLKLINRVPTIVAVQSEGSNNIVQNLDRETPVFEPGQTVADSISVTIPRNFYMAKNYIKTYSGFGIAVSDKEIIEASVILSNKTGLFSEPAAVSAFAGYQKCVKNNLLNNDARILLLLTGSGLKDLKATQTLVSLPKTINCDLEAVKKVLE
jgi:threonine synthase